MLTCEYMQGRVKAKAKQAAKKVQTFFKKVAKKATAAKAATSNNISACFRRQVCTILLTLLIRHHSLFGMRAEAWGGSGSSAQTLTVQLPAEQPSWPIASSGPLQALCVVPHNLHDEGRWEVLHGSC